MKSQIKNLVSCGLTVLLLTGCSTWNKLDRTEKGAVIGGGTGVVVGNVVSPGLGGTAVGGALGALGGGVIAHETDDENEHRH